MNSLDKINAELARLERKQKRADIANGVLWFIIVVSVYGSLFFLIAPYFHGWRP